MTNDSKQPLVSVITCTYNRADSLPNVYKSLLAQTYKSFEWIVSDDGSSDNTRELVENWIKEDKITIIYHYQENNGKHIATNSAFAIANGYFSVNIDSDDIMRPNALEIFVNAWNTIPREEWDSFYAVKARCFNPNTNKPIGRDIPNGRLVCHYLDSKYKLKIQDEMWSMTRLEASKEYASPDIRGGRKNGGLRFYPEGIGQDLASRKYKILLINDAIRGYNTDDGSSLMGRGRKYDRSRENIHLWTHIVNNNLDYFKYDPKSFIKAFVGVAMDSFFLKRSYKEMMNSLNGFKRKFIITCFIPLGYFAYLLKK